MLRTTLADERGFTLIEVLIVVMVIGLLAAIALTTFVGQSHKAQDTSAKSNARNMVTEVESCYAQQQDYGRCTTAAGSDLDHDIPDTTVTSASRNNFLVTATSRNDNTFSVERTGATVARSCTRGGSTQGGCPSSLQW